VQSWSSVAVVFVGSMSLVACSGSTGGSSAQESGPPTVQATSYPVWYAAKRIGAPRTKPDIILPAGQDAATWQPSGEVVASLSEADLILINGAGFEGWIKTATLPTAKVVDASKGVSTVEIEGPTHSHAGSAEHSHTGVDPHIWADPERFLQQARNVHAALVQADPAGQKIYDGQLGAVERNVKDLVAELDPVLERLKLRPKVANHPTFTYLADRGGFEIPVVDLDPTQAPSPEQVTALTEAYEPGTLLLWEAVPTAQAREALPDFQHVVLDPLEGPRGDSYDYFAQSRLNVATLDKALRQPMPESDTDADADDAPAPPTPEGMPGVEVPASNPE